MIIAVEYIKWLQQERANINHIDLEDIEFYENGMKLEIPKEVLDNFKFIGLNNIDFIWSDFYKKKEPVKIGKD